MTGLATLCSARFNALWASFGRPTSAGRPADRPNVFKFSHFFQITKKNKWYQVFLHLLICFWFFNIFSYFSQMFSDFLRFSQIFTDSKSPQTLQLFQIVSISRFFQKWYYFFKILVYVFANLCIVSCFYYMFSICQIISDLFQSFFVIFSFCIIFVWIFTEFLIFSIFLDGLRTFKTFSFFTFSTVFSIVFRFAKIFQNSSDFHKTNMFFSDACQIPWRF